MQTIFCYEASAGINVSKLPFCRITKVDRKEVHQTHCLAKRALTSDNVHSFPDQHLLQGASMWILYYCSVVSFVVVVDGF